MVHYLIAHDLGTSGNKASLFTTDGKLIRSQTVSYPHPLCTRTYCGAKP